MPMIGATRLLTFTMNNVGSECASLQFSLYQPAYHCVGEFPHLAYTPAFCIDGCPDSWKVIRAPQGRWRRLTNVWINANSGAWVTTPLNHYMVVLRFFIVYAWKRTVLMSLGTDELSEAW